MGILHPLFEPSELLIPFTIVSFWIGSEGWGWAAWWYANSPLFSRINYSQWWLGKNGPVMLWISIKVLGGFRVWTTGFSWILPRLRGFGFWDPVDGKSMCFFGAEWGCTAPDRPGAESGGPSLIHGSSSNRCQLWLGGTLYTSMWCANCIRF